ncbi:MAG: PH domain-containing protein [Candidatus Saccharibacteria bacterium]|nr:PH domain-containing protein [Candidatus Saccharibacteria bacterium]
MQKDLAKLRHQRSQKDFPDLKLEDSEYVVLDVRRSPLGLVAIWGLAALIVVLLGISFSMARFSDALNVLGFQAQALNYILLIIMILLAIAILSALIATKVYKENRLIVTNRRLFHHNSISLFAKSLNVIDLTSIEDVSFRQSGIIDQIFKIGTIRLSTVGDETTYTFKYVDTPTDELDTITHLVHQEKEREKEVHS